MIWFFLSISSQEEKKNWHFFLFYKTHRHKSTFLPLFFRNSFFAKKSIKFLFGLQIQPRILISINIFFLFNVLKSLKKIGENTKNFIIINKA